MFLRTHRESVKPVQEQSRVLNVLFLMFESGVIYVLLQVIPSLGYLHIRATHHITGSVFYCITVSNEYRTVSNQISFL